MHTVAVLALDDVIPFDLTTPIEVFSRSRLPDGRAAYRVRVCGTGEVETEWFSLRPHHGLGTLAEAVVWPQAEPLRLDLTRPTDADAVGGAAVGEAAAAEHLDRGRQVERDDVVEREHGHGVHDHNVRLPRILAKAFNWGFAAGAGWRESVERWQSSHFRSAVAPVP